MSVDPEIAAIYEEPLSPEEFERRLREALVSVDGEEGEEISALIAWFQRRYPTSKERLAYCRRKIAELRRAHGSQT